MSRLIYSLFTGLTGIGVLMASSSAFAQQTPVDFARAYAPMYWFAIDEPLYPTLPHPFAFDGVAIRTGTAPCRLELDKGGKPDFFNPTELMLGETCDRVALKRRFRPLLHGASHGAPSEEAPRPRMRILFDGPRYFSGGIDVTAYREDICKSDPTNLVSHLRKYRALPDRLTESKVTEATSFSGLKPDPVSKLCRGTFTYQQRRSGVTEKEQEPAVKFRLRLVWLDTCRNVFKMKLPKDGCKGEARVMAFSGNKVLDEEVNYVLKPRYLIQYWAYFSYDRGFNGHRHDGEHMFVFIEGDHGAELSLDAEVVAIVGGGHEEDAANNILLAGSLHAAASVIDSIDFPERLPRHPMVLVELGKHASAPDRNLNGRFDMGVDANLWGENVWGSRDTQSALFGKAQLGKMQPWYSMPRSSDGIFTEENAWQAQAGKSVLPQQYGTGYPHGIFAEFAARVNTEITQAEVSQGPNCDFGKDRTYRLMPIPTLKGLTEESRSASKDPKEGWSRVRGFLENHKVDFWEKDCDRGLPAPDSDQAGSIMAGLQGWIDTETEKRDVWLHRKFVKPDSVFKTHLFPRWSLGWGWRSFSGERQHVLLLRTADLGKTRFLHDSTLEVAGGKRHAELTVENFRGRYRGWYSGFSTDTGVNIHRRWNFRAGYELQFPLETVPGLGGVIKKALKGAPWFWQRTRMGLRLGGRGLLWGGSALEGKQSTKAYQNFAFEWSLNLSYAVIVSKHPLKFFGHVGVDPKEGQRR